MDRLMLIALNTREMLLTPVRRTLRREEGQGTMEYVLIIGIIVIAVLGLLWLFWDQLEALMGETTQKVDQWGDEARSKR